MASRPSRPRPHDVAGSRTSDNATIAIAQWALTHPDRPASDQPGLHQLRIWFQQTRTWLDHAGRNDTAPTIRRDRTELQERHHELVDILATAPDDVRSFINGLGAQQVGGDQISDELITALDHDTERREWILDHWPHIVEYTEVDRAMSLPTIGATTSITID